MPRPPWEFPLWSPITAPLGAVWARVAAARRRLHARRPERAHRFDVPVISVGNLVVGGSGKTPFVSTLLERLPDELQPALVLGRGYGAPVGEDGLDEEGAMLATRHPEACVAQGKDRVVAAASAAADSPAIILDDGFQHFRIARDLDIVLVDAGDLARPRYCLPAGPWREDLDAANAADLLVLTRIDEVETRDLERARAILAGRFPRTPVLECRHAVRDLVDAQGRREAAESLHDRKVVAISGIARPRSFHRSVEKLGARIVGAVAFPDHAIYGAGARSRIERLLRRHPEAAVLTTEKDLAKLAALLPERSVPQLRALRIDLSFEVGLDTLDGHLATLLGVS